MFYSLKNVLNLKEKIHLYNTLEIYLNWSKKINKAIFIFLFKKADTVQGYKFI